MKWLLWSIRSAFCKHEWEYSEDFRRVWDGAVNESNIVKQGTRISATCKKCGWHRSYWKG